MKRTDKNNNQDAISILVVDDEKFICDLCYDTLSHAGFKVEKIFNPKAAIKKLSQAHFDLVLTDIKMPNINGLELIKILKSDFPDMPVVIMTGYPTIETAIEALNQGATYYVRKPFNIDELVLTVKKAIEKRKLLRENIRLQTQINFFKLSEEINSQQDPAQIKRILLDATVKETRALCGALFEVDNDTQQVYLSLGINLDGVLEYKTKLGKFPGLPGQILRRKSPVNIESWQQKMANYHSIGEEKLAQFAIGLPLKSDHLIIGTLCLYRDDSPFSVADVDGALILAIQASIALKNVNLALDVENLFLESMKSLAIALDERDPYTHGHSMRVGQVAAAIGRNLGLTDSQVEELEMAGNLHDIGKIGIRDSILFKRGRLTPKEHEIIKTHSEKGYNILKNIKRLSAVVEAVYCHHEWSNGQGYPRGLKSDEIPLAASIIAVADAFDTIVSDRHYRKKRRYSEAIKVLEEKSGKQFSPEVVKALCQVSKKELPL